MGEAVEDGFGYGHRHAARLVQQAWAAGLLPATTPGKRKASTAMQTAMTKNANAGAGGKRQQLPLNQENLRQGPQYG